MFLYSKVLLGKISEGDILTLEHCMSEDLQEKLGGGHE